VSWLIATIRRCLRSQIDESIIQKFSKSLELHIPLEMSKEKVFAWSKQNKRRGGKKRRFGNGICAFHPSQMSFCFLILCLVRRVLMLSYIFSIHLCNVHFVAIHRKTGSSNV
jgi:hypothetical protein